MALPVEPSFRGFPGSSTEVSHPHLRLSPVIPLGLLTLWTPPFSVWLPWPIDTVAEHLKLGQD